MIHCSNQAKLPYNPFSYSLVNLRSFHFHPQIPHTFSNPIISAIPGADKFCDLNIPVIPKKCFLILSSLFRANLKLLDNTSIVAHSLHNYALVIWADWLTPICITFIIYRRLVLKFASWCSQTVNIVLKTHHRGPTIVLTT